MAIGGGTITLRQIITEWANGLSWPQNLSSFRRNLSNDFAFCPTNYDTITTLPTAGNLSASSFRNTNAEASAQTIINGWFPSQTNNFFRMAQVGNGSGAPGSGSPLTFYSVVNDPISRFEGSRTTNYTFSGNSTNSRAYSKRSTILQWLIGSQATVNTTGPAAAGTNGAVLHQAYNWREQTLRVSHCNFLHRVVTNGVVSYSRLANRGGAWDGMYVLPGRWVANAWVQQPVTAASFTPGSGDFSVTIPAGQILFFTCHNTFYDQDMSSFHPLTVPAGVSVTRSTGFWYNVGVHQVFYNGTGSAQTVTWGGAWSLINDKSNSVGQPIGMFGWNDGANGHQYFLLNRGT